MRRVQDAALTLFEQKGFDAVTVEEVARAADVGVASVFRNFYASDKKRLLRRTDLAAKTPSLAAGTREEMTLLRGGLEAALKKAVPRPFRRRVLAAAMVGALEVAIETWRSERAKRPMGAVLREAFRELGRLR